MAWLKRLWRWWAGEPIDWSHEPTKDYTDWLEQGPR